jgi:hypothetical protein
VEKVGGRGRTDEARAELPRLHALLERACAETGTLAPELPARAAA